MSRHDLKIDEWDTNPNKKQFGSKHKTGTVKFQSNADFYFPLKWKESSGIGSWQNGIASKVWNEWEQLCDE